MKYLRMHGITSTEQLSKNENKNFFAQIIVCKRENEKYFYANNHLHLNSIHTQIQNLRKITKIGFQLNRRF